MRVAIFTGSSSRHIALAKILALSTKLDIVRTYFEKGSPLEDKNTGNTVDPIITSHLNLRRQTEEDFFGLFLNETATTISQNEEFVERKWFSSCECLSVIKSLNPDLIVVYGTSILRGKIVDLYANRILNMHLGLSPYYRGSGTNYFPFVNKEPEYCGTTYMYLDSGIDTGEIIHQIRPSIKSSDDYHQLSGRFLVKSFLTYRKLIESFNQIVRPAITNSETPAQTPHLYYKKSNFTPTSISKLRKNFSEGMLQEYINNASERCAAVPIMVQPFLREKEL